MLRLVAPGFMGYASSACFSKPAIYTRFELIALITAFVLLAGCISRGAYPEQWAEKLEAEHGRCPVIDGEYLNEGELFEKVSHNGLVRHTTTIGALGCAGCRDSERMTPAAGSLGSFTEDYERFRIEYAGEILAITAVRGDGTTDRVELRPKARCKDSLLYVESGWWSTLEEEEGQTMFGVTLGMSMMARESWQVGRAKDGALLVRQSSFGSFMVLAMPVFPMGASGWIRFPEANESLKPDQQSGVIAQPL